MTRPLPPFFAVAFTARSSTCSKLPSRDSLSTTFTVPIAKLAGVHICHHPWRTTRHQHGSHAQENNLYFYHSNLKQSFQVQRYKHNFLSPNICFKKMIRKTDPVICRNHKKVRSDTPSSMNMRHYLHDISPMNYSKKFC